ncbi:hypothetical protein BGZ76_003238 [Entomortierella beljakovae]|nr:hypothetical protein BGZ76_003238 [Entomortierella beljakovae]
MRLFFIPISRNAKLMHCHSTLPQNSSSSYINRATRWAGGKWEDLSKSKPDSMQLKLYVAGSRMLEKIEHRETFLKEVPAKEDVTITSKESQVQTEFSQLLQQRIPYHRKNMIYSVMWVPVTSLFTIVPVIPNIPFFYNAFRIWSHWKAYNGAKHLELLLKNGSLDFQPSDALNFGLAHDPEFAVFFTGSHQLSIKRNARKKYPQQDPKSPVITESSGEDTPVLISENGDSAAGKVVIKKDPHHSTTAKDDDPLSITDHVVAEGFIRDAEIQFISLAYRDAPHISRETKRARYQEAEKFVKAKMTGNKLKQN